MAKENIEILNHSRQHLMYFHIHYCVLRIIVLALHVWLSYYNAEVQNDMDDFDKYLGLAWTFTYFYSRISPALSFLQFSLSVSFFFLLQIITTMVIYIIVAWFLILFLDFSFGRRFCHMPLGRLNKVLTIGWDNTILGAEWIFEKENEKVCFLQELFSALLT